MHFRNSSKEWTGLQNIGEKEGLVVLTIPKPFGTRFVNHKKAALYAMRINWVPLILFFSNKRETERCVESAGWLKKYFLNFEFFANCHVYCDILDWMSITSLALQTDQDGKSIVDARNTIESLRLKLITLQAIPGPLEATCIKQLNEAVDVVAHDIPMLGPHTRHQTEGNNEDGENFKHIALTCKNLSTKKIVVYDELFVFNINIDVIETVKTRRKEATESLSESLSTRFREFCNDDSVFGKLGWLNHRSWVTLTKSNVTPEQNKQAAKTLEELGKNDVQDLYIHFKVRRK